MQTKYNLRKRKYIKLQDNIQPLEINNIEKIDQLMSKTNYFYKSIKFTFNTKIPNKFHPIWKIGKPLTHPMNDEIKIDLSHWRINNNKLYGIYEADHNELAYVQLLALQNKYLSYLVFEDGSNQEVEIDVNKTYEIVNSLYQKWLQINLEYYLSSKDKLNNTKSAKINTNWISASRLKNYVLQSPLNDWIEIFKPELNKMDKIEDAMRIKILNEGINYEETLFNRINNSQFEVIQIAYNYRDCHLFSNYLKTIQAMRELKPIIYQGILYNCTNKTYGMPDLLIRGDIIQKIFGCDLISNLDSLCDVSSNNIYYVVDIKNSKLKVNLTSGRIANSSTMTRFYRVQLYFYNEALRFAQGYYSNMAFLWGKSRNLNEPYIPSEFSNTTLGVVYFDSFDEDISNINDIVNNYYSAISWVKEVRNDGKLWDPQQPHRLELFPNLKYEYETAAVKQYKYDLSKNNPLISELWQCTHTHQKIALENNITNWRMQSCDVQKLGFNLESKNAKILDLIIKMNQCEKLFKNNFPQKIVQSGIHPLQLKTQIQSSKFEFYLDFEFEQINSEQIIFMIGLGYKLNSQFTYSVYIADELTLEAEQVCFIRMLNDIHTITEGNSCLFVHWGNIECSLLTKKLIQMNISSPIKYEMFDLNTFFKSEPIIVRGALNFGLKTIAKSLFDLGYIKTIWKENINGENLTYFIDLYYRGKGDDRNSKEIEKKMIEYNYIDVKVLQEIIDWLRKHFK